MRLALFVLVLVVSGPLTAQAPQDGGLLEGRDFRVYDRAGRAVTMAAIVTRSAEVEVVLLGEEHDDMVGHDLQAVLFEELLLSRRARGGDGSGVVLSLEMFERDVQHVVDEYLADFVTEEHFLSSARPWDHYDERYRALVEAAKREGVPVVAANAPRRYVNRVTRLGPESLEALPDDAKRFLPPLPYPGPSEAYRAQWDEIMRAAMPADTSDAGAPGHTVPEHAIDAQALWDASMGYAITTALMEHLGALVVHVAGSFHVARGTGIPERIDDYRPGTRVLSVVATKADDVDAWSETEHGDLADFVVLTRRPSNGG